MLTFFFYDIQIRLPRTEPRQPVEENETFVYFFRGISLRELFIPSWFRKTEPTMLYGTD